MGSVYLQADLLTSGRINIKAWLPVSTTECIASENIAELPVIAVATNFVVATIRLPIKAAMMTFLDTEAVWPPFSIIVYWRS